MLRNQPEVFKSIIRVYNHLESLIKEYIRVNRIIFKGL